MRKILIFRCRHQRSAQLFLVTKLAPTKIISVRKIFHFNMQNFSFSPWSRRNHQPKPSPLRDRRQPASISAPRPVIDPTSIYSASPTSVLVNSDNNGDYTKMASLSSAASQAGNGVQSQSASPVGRHPTSLLFAVCFGRNPRRSTLEPKQIIALASSRSSRSCWISNFGHKPKHYMESGAFAKLATDSKNNQLTESDYLASDSRIRNHYSSQSIELAEPSNPHTLRQVFELYLIISCHLYSLVYPVARSLARRSLAIIIQ